VRFVELTLPCPLDAGWEVVRTVDLPKRGADGSPLGGFSAAAYQPELDRLWLLSDAPRGHLIPWSGLSQLLNGQTTSLNPGSRLLIRDEFGHPLPEGFDGEGLVLIGSSAWIASEGRRTPDRVARLIRININTGRQQQVLQLPSSWRELSGRGLATNQGPESLTALAPAELLFAAERPLLQSKDPLLVPIARVNQGTEVRPESTLQIQLLKIGAGLTELLALPAQRKLLALVRGFQPPLTWSAQLLLFPYPSGTDSTPPLQPLHGWNLLTAGLPADNWEALAIGPKLRDGRTTMILGSDDNFNPRQSSWLAVMAPRRSEACYD